LYRAIEQDRTVVVPITSANKASEIHKYITEKFPSKWVGYYSSSSGSKSDFNNVNEVFVNYDVLIYTPTLTAGVSFDMCHFDVMFCWFDPYSCNAETCVQMMGRIRELKDHEYYIHVTKADTTITRQMIINSIQKWMNEYIKLVENYNIFDNSSLEDFDWMIYQIDNYVTLNNTISRYKLIDELVWIFCWYTNPTNIVANDNYFVDDVHSTNLKKTIEELYWEFVTIPLLSPTEYNRLSDLPQDELSINQM